MAIPIALFTILRRRPDVPFPTIFWLFGLFIVSCGLTHLVDALSTHIPMYRLLAAAKAITAVISVVTVIALFRAVPRMLVLQSIADLRQQVDERAQAEARLRRLTEDLERSNRELQEFASVASHDLQEPLRKILAFGDRLEKKYGGALDEAGRDYLTRMCRSAARMRVLITDLLSISRVHTRARPFQPVHLNDVLDDVLSDLEAGLEEASATVDVDELPTIDGDATQMRQLFANLIGNAVKFRRPTESPHVQVKSRALEASEVSSLIPAAAGRIEQSYCEITVQDNGIGFEERYLDRIFDMFQRLHGRSEHEGTGMGLAICRRIVERHGGELTARSQPGVGSTFIIRLPLKQVEEVDA